MQPTTYTPGSDAKIELLAARDTYGLPLWVDGDKLDGREDGVTQTYMEHARSPYVPTMHRVGSAD